MLDRLARQARRIVDLVNTHNPIAIRGGARVRVADVASEEDKARQGRRERGVARQMRDAGCEVGTGGRSA